MYKENNTLSDALENLRNLENDYNVALSNDLEFDELKELRIKIKQAKEKIRALQMLQSSKSSKSL
jgi:hypothetical protein